MKRQGSYRWRLAWVSVVIAVGFAIASAKADVTFGEPVNLGPTVNSEYIPSLGILS